MKKSILLLVGVLFISSSYSQDITDALRYSQDEIQGTARFRALSGAFGALGGDMSAVSINPAGSAIFNSSHISFTLSNLNKKNKTQYFEGFDSASNSNINFNQAGAAFVFNNSNPESDWKKFVLSVSYDNIQDYDNDWFAHGTNSNSIDGYFLYYANGLGLEPPQGLPLIEISAFPGESYSEAYLEIGYANGFGHQQAFLGYESFILEPESNTDENTVYTSNIAAGDFQQEYAYVSTGYNGKFTFNAATQYKDKLYLGINLNSHFISYLRYTHLLENNNNIDTNISTPIKLVDFDNNLSTFGSGFSFQLGGIFKLSDDFRIGVTYNSPTWMTIREETTQDITTVREDTGTNVNQYINPLIINVFPRYDLQTPGKFTGSLAYIFGDRGLISFDYSLKDYSNTKFKQTYDSYFSAQNNIISNSLTTVSSYKVGGEFRHKELSFRGGYRLEESPYKNGQTVGDLTGYSLGLGYNFGKAKLDITYDHAERSNQHQLYSVGLTDVVTIDSKSNNVTMSLSFNL